MTKVGRNDACPCGSGKKFKKCCSGGDVPTLTSVSLEPVPAPHILRSGSYGVPGGYFPSIAAWGEKQQLAYVLVLPGDASLDQQQAATAAEEHIKVALALAPDGAAAVAMSLKGRGYVRVDDAKVAWS